PADVARQGGNLELGAGTGRRRAGRADPRGDAQLLSRRPLAPSRLGLWLRRLPGLRPAPPGLGDFRPGRAQRRMNGFMLHYGVASFEMRPLGAPQDEAKLLMALRMNLILRNPRSGRLEGRAVGNPAARHRQ